MWVEADSIAVATHGRGFYILDDIAPLRQAGLASGAANGFTLFKPADAIRTVGPATISYLLTKPAEKLTLDILDAKGDVVRTIKGTVHAEPRRAGEGRGEASRARPRRRAGGVDGRRAEPRHVESRLSAGRDVPGHDSLGRDDERPDGPPGQVPGPAHGGRRIADAAA